eukprot:1024209-Rhodomonas_salina.2
MSAYCPAPEAVSRVGDAGDSERDARTGDERSWLRILTGPLQSSDMGRSADIGAQVRDQQ